MRLGNASVSNPMKKPFPQNQRTTTKSFGEIEKH
jgi:hypothetical protein